MNATPLYSRLIKPRVAEALLDTPVVLIAGPRQAGKTTLVRLIAEQQGRRYLTMDDELTLLSAREDPVAMIRSCCWQLRKVWMKIGVLAVSF